MLFIACLKHSPRLFGVGVGIGIEQIQQPVPSPQNATIERSITSTSKITTLGKYPHYLGITRRRIDSLAKLQIAFKIQHVSV